MTETLIRQKFNQAIQQGLNFAAVRLPGSSSVHYCYSSQQPVLQKVALPQTNVPEFVCSPYGAGNLGYVMPAESFYTDENLVYGNLLPDADPAGNSSFILDGSVANSFAGQQAYEAYVQKAIDTIKKDQLDKVVAARSESFPLKKDFDAASFFYKLCNAYPSASIYFFYIKEIGCWCGATPEKLLTVEKNILQTVALAGTLPVESVTPWSDKEKEEQQMTAFFIEEIFKAEKLKNYRQTDIETITAGAIKHLRSTFSWKPGAELLSRKFSKLLQSINPTPAVCGLPQFEAFGFIAENENLERRFYSGFIGLLQKKETHLFVNLRCMQLAENNAILYAGAGITEHSDSDAEWFETVNKIDTLSSILKTL